MPEWYTNGVLCRDSDAPYIYRGQSLATPIPLTYV